ncbi:toxin TcdB middle/N-terminal domain-containing protein [Methylibium sp.]|uniref:toxin TcdB middle/N-terminal domain-containing protein n=1 Tax=Methylibium sp. TaxID=2067992 RepID=UPI0017F5DF1C|nr:toxin TcdB middle/N-terminal domain-containing protein [Methylibium sp.]MBA3588460.1 VCBS repeat-containing protein [Methylibium sp.]
MSIDVGFASQAPSLPGGGGGLDGLGETFTPDLHSGTGAFNVPLGLPNGPNDIGPKLSLRYDSASGNGPFGMGWSLQLPRILRSTMIGRPRYDNSDTLVLEGSGPLVRLPDGSLRPEVETGDWRIERLGDGFRVTDRAGTRYELGTSADSRIAGLAGGTWAWLAHRVEDNLGQTATFTWRASGAQRYLDELTYGPYRVEFHHEPRPDPLRWGRGGFLLQTDERCAKVELHLVGAAHSLVRRWALGYSVAQPNGASLLSSITLSGFDDDGASLSAPPLRLAYTEPAAPRLQRMGALDEGALPPGLGDRGRVELVDWNGNGLPDVLEIGTAGTARVWPNLGGLWGRPRNAGLVPQLASTGAQAALVDIDGDGLADVVRVDQPLRGYQPRTPQGFARPVAWGEAPALALASPRCRLADFDGNGLIDLLWSNGNALMLAQRNERGDWLPTPVVVPATPAGPPSDLADPHVFCADMTGDGSPDVVRVDGRGVTYWPYLGFGRFGDAVSMTTPPRLPFDVDPNCVFVVDLDGDGCADVIYVGDGLVRWWPNRWGSGFEAPREIEHLPTEAMRDLRVADLFGTGSPGLCWTATLASGRARWFVLDPLGGVRCGLLNVIDNSIGRRTQVSYSTSALEASRDALRGAAWTTRLPFVLSVVGEVRISDQSGGADSVTRFAYHEGRYDGVLREVCGFGRVESEDVGDASVATLRTTRWFHTGLLPDGTEPATQAERRRWRAIRGRLFRQERTGEDGRRFDRLTQDWEVADATAGFTVVPHLRRNTRFTFEGAPTAVSWIVSEQLAWDPEGNVTEAVEHSFVEGQAEPTATLHTFTDYAVDPAGRFRQRLSRARQTDGEGTLLAETRAEYDQLPLGEVGAQGLLTARAALALTDAGAVEVYGADPPDFAALGYTRRAGTNGWWVELGRFERMVDADGLHGRITGPRGGVSALRFDTAGCYPVRVRDAMGNEVRAEFDLRVYQPTAITEPSGARSTARFDALARMLNKVEPGDSDAEPTVSYTYDTSTVPVQLVVSHRTSAATPRRTERQFIDGNGQLIERRVSDALGEVIDACNVFGPRGVLARTYLTRRPAGAAYAAPEPGDPHTEIVYDALGRAVRTIRPDGAIATARYLPGLIEEADEEDNRADASAQHTGTVTRRFVDVAGRVTRIEQLLGTQVLTSSDTYDVKGRLIEHVDASGVRTRFTHDLLGHVLRVERPEQIQVAVIDASGNTVESRTGSARVLRRFDLANRPIEVRHGSAAMSPVARYVYHDNGAPAPADAGLHTAGGRLVRIDDEGGVVLYDYDERGRISRKSMQWATDGPLVLQTSHRPDGLIDLVTYPDGTLARYRYDERGRLHSIEGVIDSIEYDIANRRTAVHYSNGTVQRDGHHPLTSWRSSSALSGPSGTLREVGYRHDSVGNVIALTSPDTDLAWQYRYDDLYRLTRATGAAGDWQYAYDAAGNTLSASDVGAYSYGGDGVPATCLRSAGSDTFTYDDHGHVATAPWGKHSVDAEGRLRRIDLAAGGREEFTYDHTGNLVRRWSIDSAGGVREIWSPDKLLRVEGGVLELQFTDGTRIVARQRASVRTWQHVDHLGSLVLATDQAGAVALSIGYGPYGQVLRRSGGATSSQGFATGQAMGPGLVLLRARWYSPRIGRFLSPDSMIGDAGDPLAWNFYAYCRCNPTSYVDPSGRSFWKIFAAIVATVAIIALAVIVTAFTFGIGTPGAVALTVGGLSVTWGAVFAATAIGIAAGGLIGGIAAARAGGDAGDIVLGALVGGAVGGWAAFGAAFAGAAVAGGIGLAPGGIAAGAVSGGVSGLVNGAAMGFASGFAGGKNNGFKDVMEKVLVGAIIGAAVGAGIGALSGVKPPANETPRQALEKSMKPDMNWQPDLQAPGAPPATPVNSFSDAAGKVGTGLLGKGAGAVAPHVAQAASGVTSNIAVQTVLVDLHAAAASAFWDDLQDYVRTHNVDLGPLNFIRGEL